jgi:transcription elongation factor Elf1
MREIESRTPNAKSTFSLPDWNCPHCNALAKLLECLWDARTANRVRVFECTSCGKLIWDQ